MNKEQQTKYPWHEAPENAMWAATDEDGEAYWYAVEPEVQYGYYGVWVSDFEGGIGYFPELRDDWQNSLEKRPGT
jgi:hypothetical protein